MSEAHKSPAETGALVIWHDVAPGAEALVAEWYNREHHAERVAIPGFRSARRYEAIAGEPSLFCLYGTDRVSVLASPAYLERVNAPTEWSRRALPMQRNMIRTACRCLLRLGGAEGGEGGIVATWRLNPRPGRAEPLVTWLIEEALPALAGRPNVVHAALYRGDPEATGGASGEKALRGAADRRADVIVVVSANAAEPLRQVRAGPLDEAQLTSRGAQPESPFGLYRLIYAL